MWVQLIIAIVMMIASFYLTPKPKVMTNKLKPSEVTVPQATAGAPIQVIFGTMWVQNPNTLWTGGQRSVGIYK